ncbi:hypothetical protein ACVJGD_008747 [Bradyrhizobium sp. USDA 10063]
MRNVSGSAILAATVMLWTVSTVVPAAAANPKITIQTSSKAGSALKPSEFSAQRRHHRHVGHIRHHRRAFALYRPYHYRAYYRPRYRAYYRPYRAFGFYPPWYRPYGAYYRPAYTYYRPLGYGWPYRSWYYGPRTYVSIGFGPFSFGFF